jgi:uncharacterized protein YlxP (DUF503 family)
VRVGTLEIDFRIPGSASLKEKRKVVASLKDRIRGRYPVAIAEVGHQDLRARALLGVAAVAETGAPIERTLDEIVRFVESDPRVLVVDVVRDDW